MVGVLGSGFATSINKDDQKAVGTLTSPSFVIERDYIHFLLGAHEIHWLTDPHEFSKLQVELLIKNEVVRSIQPSRYHAMFWEGWNVSEYRDMEAKFRIVDKDKRKGSHIDVDHIFQSNLPVDRSPIKRTLNVQKPILNFPIKEGNPRYYLELMVDGKKVRDADVELSTGDEIDYWVFTDVSSWLGKELEIRSQAPPLIDTLALERLRLEDYIVDAEDLYREELRPQFHFSTKRGWVNDPNGLVYYDGEYHLFYQHNPYGWDHSRDDVNKHWGHAVSSDLVHWDELPDAIYPDHLGSIYSGSAVVDERNTTGLQTGEEKVIIALYTSAGGRTPWSRNKLFSQSLAYSNDRGRTFISYDLNPVQENIEYINRDPKAIWYEPTDNWVIVLHFDERAMGFFTSPDLKSWTFESEIELPNHLDMSDCPELFQLPINGDDTRKKWILYGGSGAYLIGNFDGKYFKAEEGPIQFNHGNAFYASQLFNNMPEGDPRKIQIAWGRVEMPNMPFNQQMLFPVELSLRSTRTGLRIFAKPVREIEAIHREKIEWQNTRLESGYRLVKNSSNGLYEINAEFEIERATSFGFRVNGLDVVYDSKAGEVVCGNYRAQLEPKNNTIQMRLLIDKTTLEIFVNDGEVYMPMRMVSKKTNNDISILARGAKAKVSFLNLIELASIWN